MRIGFMGSSLGSVESLRALLREDSFEVVGVVTQPDRPAGRGKTLTPCAVAKFVQERDLSVPLLKPERVNAPEVVAEIASWKADVLVVVAYGQILKKPLLELTRFGCVNCHFSLLPKYRGAAPVVACLEEGDRMTGVTVMQMGEGLDDGPILLQSYEPIYPDTTGGTLMDDLAIAGGVALAKALRLMEAGRLPKPVPQDPQRATYVKKLKKSDGLIAWDSPVLEIERRIRAFNPWPGSYTFLPPHLRKKGTEGRLVVLRSKMIRLLPGWETARPGTLLALDRAGPIVRCHDTALQLLEVKPEGSSRMDGGAFARGRPFVALKDEFLPC